MPTKHFTTKLSIASTIGAATVASLVFSQGDRKNVSDPHAGIFDWRGYMRGQRGGFDPLSGHVNNADVTEIRDEEDSEGK